MKKIKLLFTTLLFCIAVLHAMEEGDNQLQQITVSTNSQEDQIRYLNNHVTHLNSRIEILEDGQYITLQKQALQKGRSAVLKLVLQQETLGLAYVTLGYFMSTYDPLNPSDHQGQWNNQLIPVHLLINSFGWIFQYEGILSAVNGLINLTTLPTNSVNCLTEALNNIMRFVPSPVNILQRIFNRN